MSTELKSRRDTNTNLMATTPAEAEFGYDTTNKRPIIGDASKAGGHPIATWQDIQAQKFTALTSAGTAAAMTLTFTTQLIPAAYAIHQRFAFIAGTTSTGVTTINVNALGAKTIKKVTAAGALADLVAGDITSGRPYEIYYDGTYFVMMGGAGGGSVDAVVGDYVTSWQRVDTGVSVAVAAGWVKVMEAIVNRDGNLRVRIGGIQKGLGAWQGRIYINGGAAGTTRTITGTFQTWDEDLAVSADDLVQLYVDATGASAADVSGNTVDDAALLAIMEGAPESPAFDEWQTRSVN